jgi:hypothetical protein
MKNVGVHDSYILGRRETVHCAVPLLSGFRARCGSSRFQNGSRGREDAGCSVVGNFLFGSQQVYRLRRDGLSPDGKLIQYA